jgi:hypothetical protein
MEEATANRIEKLSKTAFVSHSLPSHNIFSNRAELSRINWLSVARLGLKDVPYLDTGLKGKPFAIFRFISKAWLNIKIKAIITIYSLTQ